MICQPTVALKLCYAFTIGLTYHISFAFQFTLKVFLSQNFLPDLGQQTELCMPGHTSCAWEPISGSVIIVDRNPGVLRDEAPEGRIGCV
jgi:hypothetical protein